MAAARGVFIAACRLLYSYGALDPVGSVIAAKVGLVAP